MERDNERHLQMMSRKWCSWMKRAGAGSDSCPEDEILAAYHDHNLKEEEAENIERHLASCDNCLAYLTALSGGMNAFNTGQQVSVPKSTLKKAGNLVRSKPGIVRKRRLFSWTSPFRPLPAMAAASVALVLVLLSTLLWHAPDHKTGNQLAFLRLDIVGRVSTGAVTRGKDSVYREVVIKEDGVLHSGDMFKVIFEVEQEGYVYVLGLDSRGHAILLFPGEKDRFPFRAEATRPYSVPGQDQWFRLDDRPGREQIMLLLSKTPLDGFQEKRHRLKDSGFDEIVRSFPQAVSRMLYFQHQ